MRVARYAWTAPKGKDLQRRVGAQQGLALPATVVAVALLLGVGPPPDAETCAGSICTHADEVPPGADTTRVRTTEELREADGPPADREPPACVGDGFSGPRVHVMYGRPANVPNRFAEVGAADPPHALGRRRCGAGVRAADRWRPERALAVRPGRPHRGGLPRPPRAGRGRRVLQPDQQRPAIRRPYAGRPPLRHRGRPCGPGHLWPGELYQDDSASGANANTTSLEGLLAVALASCGWTSNVILHEIFQHPGSRAGQRAVLQPGRAL